MDPNAALLAILTGDDIVDHMEALRHWLAIGGFEPVIDAPDVAAVFFKDLDTNPRLITARKDGLYSKLKNIPGTDFVCFASWHQIEAIDFDVCEACGHLSQFHPDKGACNHSYDGELCSCNEYEK